MDTTQFFTIYGTEVWLGLLALVLICVDLLTGRGRLTGPADMVHMYAVGGLALILLHTFGLEPVPEEPCGTLDAFAIFFKRFFVGTALLTLLLSASYQARFPAGRGEFPTMVVFTAMGMSMLASVNDFVSLFVALELVTVTLFLMAAWRAGLPRSIEAGIKFVIIGAIAAAFLVYGTAFVYGGTGSLDFAGVAAVVQSGESLSGALKFGLLLVIVGLGFKIGAVPFHVWIPDVYQGAPTPVTAFLAVGSKGVGVVLLMRFVYTVLGPDAGPASQWGATVFAGLAALTLLMGNLGAIGQTDLKRFLGYSGIAHAGYLLLALAAHSKDAASAMLFYMVAYLFANVLAFLVIIVVSRTEDNSHMERIDGLASRSPFLALAMTVSMLSLAGVPPFSGFVAKFLILRSAVADPTLLPVVIISLIMVVVSLYYYLCIVKRMYMRDAKDDSVLEISATTKLVLYGGIGMTFLLGIYINPLIEAANAGAQSLFQ